MAGTLRIGATIRQPSHPRRKSCDSIAHRRLRATAPRAECGQSAIASLSGERTILPSDGRFLPGLTGKPPSPAGSKFCVPSASQNHFPTQARFYKVAKRSLDDISTVAACFAISREANGKIANARLAYGGVAAVPFLAREAGNKSSKEPSASPKICARAQTFPARHALHPIGDHRGSAEYRLAMAQSLLDKFWFSAINVGQAISSPAEGRGSQW